MREDFTTENLVQDGHTPTPLGSWLFRNARFVLASLTICLLVLAVYYHVLGKLVTDWQNQDNSHGFLVPLFSAFLVWEKRKCGRLVRSISDRAKRGAVPFPR